MKVKCDWRLAVAPYLGLVEAMDMTRFFKSKQGLVTAEQARQAKQLRAMVGSRLGDKRVHIPRGGRAGSERGIKVKNG